MLIVRLLIGTDRYELQTQFPPSRIELRDGPQLWLPSLHSVLITSAARNPMDTIATTINGHRATTQKERFHSGFLGVGFLFMLFSQAFEDRHFTKRELLFGMPPRRFFRNRNETARGVILSTVRLAIRVVDLVAKLPPSIVVVFRANAR
jgi:hypothetical protein